MQQRSPDTLINYWVSLWISLNEIQRSIHSQDEFRAESRYLFFVPVIGITDIRFSSLP